MKKSNNPKLFNEDGSINKQHELTVAEVVELLACALSDIPIYNWFNRKSRPQEEFFVDGNNTYYDEYVDEMYKQIAKATRYIFKQKRINIGYVKDTYGNTQIKTIKK